MQKIVGGSRTVAYPGAYRTSHDSEELPSTTTFWFLYRSEHFDSNFRVVARIPQWSSLCKFRCLGTTSKASLISGTTTSVCVLLLFF